MSQKAATLPFLPSWRVLVAIIALFIALGVAVYSKSLGNGSVRWDDGLLIFENPAVHQISGPSIRYVFTHYDPELYIPLTFLTYQIDYQLGGASAFPFHAQNLLWHSLNALLVAWLFYLLTRHGWISLALGLLFLVHPLHTEAVAWASARKDVLSTFFFLGSLIGYLYYRAQGSSRKVYWMSITLFFLGLLSKVVVLTLPLVLLLLDFREGRKWDKKLVLEKVPYFVLSIIFGIVALFGKSDVVNTATVLQKILLSIKSTVFSLESFVAPFHLSVLYPYTKTITITSPDFFVPLIVLILLATLAFLSLRFTREIVFGLAFFFLTIAPTFLNLFKGDVYVTSDRYAYIPSIGLLFIVALFAYAAIEGSGRWLHRVLGSIAALFILGFGTLASAQSLVWKDTESLFRNVLTFYPDSYIAHNNLGNAFRRQGNLDAAIAEFQAALKSSPHAKTFANLGAVYRKQGKFDLALKQYEEALKLDQKSKEAYLGLGLVYAAQGKAADAKTAYEKAIEIDQSYSEARVNLGSLLEKIGDLAGAKKEFETAIAYDPLIPEAYFNLALISEKEGKKNDAEVQYRKAISLKNDFLPARLNLALLTYENGAVEESVAMFQQILELDPGNSSAISALKQIQGEATKIDPK